jgi:hypothetical protein
MLRNPHEPMNPWPDIPLSENDLDLARKVEPKTKGMARRDYFQRRQAMYVWRQNFREAAGKYVAFHFEMDNKPLDERIADSEQLRKLWDLAFEAYDSYQACLQHFHNAQADYRAVGGKV